jgi:RimJ/RimL family protein N-acetyltransferase
MPHFQLAVREIREEDIEPISNYWLTSSPVFMQSMGVDLSKLPGKEQWKEMLQEQISQSYEQKKSYCIIWELDGKAIGHSNINKIVFGKEAYMHLHIWSEKYRKLSLGLPFIKLTIPCFFEKYKLQNLYCEPYALNPAPNKTLAKAGFEFVKEYVTTPGWINFEQPVRLWVMRYKKFLNPAGE